MRTSAARQAADLHYLIARPYRDLVLKSVERWVDCNGFDWAADRCKSIWLFLSHRMQSCEDRTPPPAWVGVAKFLSYPLAVLKGTDEMKKLQLLQLWRIYTAFGERKTAMSEKDVSKFLDATSDDAIYPDLSTFEWEAEALVTPNWPEFSELPRWDHYIRSVMGFDPTKRNQLGFAPKWCLRRYTQWNSFLNGQYEGYSGFPLDPYSELPPVITLPVLSRTKEKKFYSKRYALKKLLGKEMRDCRTSYPNWLPELHIPSTCEVRNPLSIRKYEENGKDITPEWRELVYSSRALSWFVRNHYPWTEHWPYALRQIPQLTMEGLTEDHLDGTWRHGHVFSRIQRDGKVRFYQAAPKWAQWMMEPWGKALYKSLARIPQDCTYEQSKGVHKVQQWLNEGREVFSIDLSNATDRFPLMLTRTVLGKVCRTANQWMWLDTFCVLSRLPSQPGFRDNSRDDGIFSDHKGTRNGVEWRIGQPLGSYPSFAAFALTHHAVARAACSRAGFTSIPDMPYVLLGDDIVFGDKAAAEEYEQALQDLSVSVSKDKCLRGNLGEFAGRIILREEWEYKAKYFYVKPESLLSAIEVFGPRALRMMRKTPLRDVIALLPTTRTPGGVNPGGFSREARNEFLRNYYELTDPLADDKNYATHSFVDTKYTVQVRLDTGYDRDPSSYPSDLWPDVRDQERLRQFAPTGAISNETSGYHWPLAPYQLGKESRKMIFKPYRSRAWLRKVKQAARLAGLLT